MRGRKPKLDVDKHVKVLISMPKIDLERFDKEVDHLGLTRSAFFVRCAKFWLERKGSDNG